MTSYPQKHLRKPESVMEIGRSSDAIPERPPPIDYGGHTQPQSMQLSPEHEMGMYRYGVVHEFCSVEGVPYHPDDLDGLQVCTVSVRYDGCHDGMHFITLIHYLR